MMTWSSSSRAVSWICSEAAVVWRVGVPSLNGATVMIAVVLLAFSGCLGRALPPSEQPMVSAAAEAQASMIGQDAPRHHEQEQCCAHRGQ